VCIVDGEFETMPVGRQFDLVLAATSWHWIDPTVRMQRAWECLRPGGYLAVWNATHVFPENGDPFFDELQPVYEEIGAGMPSDAQRPRPGALPDNSDEIVADGRFENVTSDQFDWEIRYDADGYLALLNTFSGHLAMQPWQRRRLYSAIRDGLACRSDGMLRRHWGCVLQTGRRATPG
jgi:SAM-dependent methyltransferase